MIDRFFIEGELQGSVTIQGKELHHLAHVMRLKVGDSVELINGRGALAQAFIRSITKKEASFEIVSSIQEKAEPPLILAEALVRRQKLEWVIEKGCELGLTDFWLYPSDKGEKASLSSHDMERLNALLIAALKQSGRVILPRITLKPPLLLWKESLKGFIFGDVRKKACPLFAFQEEIKGAVIGPESGFSEEEVGHLESLGATGASFTSSILRTESAALTASVLLSHLRHTKSFLSP